MVRRARESPLSNDGQRWFSQLNVGSARRAGVHAGPKWVVHRECELLIYTVTQREIEYR